MQNEQALLKQYLFVRKGNECYYNNETAGTL